MIKELKNFLRENKVDFTSYYHHPVYDPRELEDHLNISSEKIAKTYLIRINGSFALLVIPSSCEVDPRKLESVISIEKVSFPHEGIQEKYMPGCEADALHPFGNLYGLKVYADQRFRKKDEIAFFAGSSRHSIKMKFSDFENLVHPVFISCCCE